MRAQAVAAAASGSAKVPVAARTGGKSSNAKVQAAVAARKRAIHSGTQVKVPPAVVRASVAKKVARSGRGGR